MLINERRVYNEKDYSVFLCTKLNGIFTITIPVSALGLTNNKIPMIKSLKQISNNQLEVTYDMTVDAEKGVMPKNYWIQSLTDKTPTGIATLGKSDKVSNQNSLTDKMVDIKATDSTNSKFILTFKDDIPSGAKYKLIICYITVPNDGPYTGDNGTAVFTGK